MINVVMAKVVMVNTVRINVVTYIVILLYGDYVECGLWLLQLWLIFRVYA